MKKIPAGIMVVLLLAVCISSCRSAPDYRWITEPAIKGAVPLPPNTPIYFYFGSKIAGIKNDMEHYNHENRRYVLCTVVRDGEISTSLPLNHYRKLEIYKKAGNKNYYISQEQLDTLIGDEYRFCMQHQCWKKYIPDKKYLWIRPEDQDGKELKPGHILLGKGKLSFIVRMVDYPGYGSEYNLKKKDFLSLASYALARGANVVIIEDEYNFDGEWDNLLLMRFEELLSGKP